ncbi:unnamed protein product [Microthlaspi erraticum]|uniref:Uncharacterized protein n=1 Tax=Microthlaspi erraticum TaxID=1685480 RepID=A0A6D2IAQ4_9BRAS|nr:unnamed protein product [Microthlaspi erraticum]
MLVWGALDNKTLKKWKIVKANKELKTQQITGLREFSYRELYAATKGFHSSLEQSHRKRSVWERVQNQVRFLWNDLRCEKVEAQLNQRQKGLGFRV